MFPERLNAVRKAKGFTAQFMADYLSIAIRTYRFWESGHSQPSLEALVKVADLFDVSTDYLLGRDHFLAKNAGEGETGLPTCPTS